MIIPAHFNDELIKIIEIQLGGKQRMTIAKFLTRGYRNIKKGLKFSGER